MTRSKLQILWMLVFALLLAPTMSMAAGAIAVLTVEQGVIKMRRGNQDRFVTPRDGLIPMEEGDDLHSGNGGKGSLFFERENQKIAIYPNSMFQVKAYTNNRSSFFLPFGKTLVSVLNKLRPQQRFEVQTATATIGIKGTEFVLGSDGFSKTYLLTLEGVVSIINPEFPNMEVLVPKDQATVSERGNPPPPPVIVPPAARETVVKSDTVKSMETLPVPTQGGNGNDKNNEEKKQDEKKQDEKKSEEKTTTDKESEPTKTSTVEATAQAQTTAALIEVVSVVQTTTETVSTAATTVETTKAATTCPSTNGCGTLTFKW